MANIRAHVSLDDAALISGALAGRPEYFDALFYRHEAAVRRRIRQILSRSAYEDDMVQDVFLKAWRFLATFRAEANFRTWLTRIAVNEVFQSYRRDRNNPISSAEVNLDEYPSHFESPERRVQRLEARRMVRRAVKHLPEKYGQVLELRDLAEMTQPETARQLRGSEPMVKSRLFRARQMLSATLRRVA